MINIVNKRNHIHTPYDYYCGRGSPLGNTCDHRGGNHPQISKRVNTREEAIIEYEKYLMIKIAEKDPDICRALNEIYQMAKKGDVNLICYCFPLACHTNVIQKVVEEKLIENGFLERDLQ